MEFILLLMFIFIPFLFFIMVFGTHRGRTNRKNTAEINAMEKMKMYRGMLEEKDISNEEKVRIDSKIEKLKKQHKSLF
ncbi:hypothetical protein [Salinicoccus albus]|uniref:hypothetical protein n=1 Tax=Salinicoccus albus TaxID=418756 RepID=UPI0003632871|nr:hypothetical protein [Salinicoccus albus]